MNCSCKLVCHELFLKSDLSLIVLKNCFSWIVPEKCFTDRKDFRLWNIDSPCVCGVEANNVSNNKIFFF